MGRWRRGEEEAKEVEARGRRGREVVEARREEGGERERGANQEAKHVHGAKTNQDGLTPTGQQEKEKEEEKEEPPKKQNLHQGVRNELKIIGRFQEAVEHWNISKFSDEREA